MARVTPLVVAPPAARFDERRQTLERDEDRLECSVATVAEIGNTCCFSGRSILLQERLQTVPIEQSQDAFPRSVQH